MIASPGDVAEEREIARDLINEWNTLHSSHRKIVLIPLLWEYSTAPASGNRAQGIINDQMLKHADLLVGIFWKRIGSSTGKAISGTVEELETHVNNSKPAMLYFSEAPLPQDFDREQYDALQKFKAEARQKNLLAAYKTLEDFRNQFRNHLALTLNDSGFFLGFKDEVASDGEIDAASVKTPDLPNEAKILLLAAVKSSDGKLIHSESKSGTVIQVNDKNFVPEQTPRIVAKWKAGLEYLIGWGYIRPLSASFYEVTESGYQLVDAEKGTAVEKSAIIIDGLVAQRSDAQYSAGMCIYIANVVTIKVKNRGTDVINDFSISVKMNKHLLSDDSHAEFEGEYAILNFNENKLFGGQSRSVKLPVKIIDRFAKDVIGSVLTVTVFTDKGAVSREYPIRSFFKMMDVSNHEVELSEVLFKNPYGV
jgi:hypothetical protein